MSVPATRIAAVNRAPVRAEGEFVLYWMIAARRPWWSFALDRAVELGRELGKPVFVLEGLRAGYPWASDRLHRFILDGMADNAAAFAGRITYYPYVEPRAGDGAGLLEAVAARACAVVTDLFPTFFLPRMVAAAAERLPIRLEQVDGCGLLPLSLSPRAFERAVDFRRHLQRALPEHLSEMPSPDLPAAAQPLLALPPEITQRWPAADLEELRRAGALATLAIDHRVAPALIAGGARAGAAAMLAFVGDALARYGERNDVASDVSSGLSPYLHYGHVSAHQILAAVAEREGWTPARLSDFGRGERTGWWGMSAPAEGFLDQAVTWRELGFNVARHRPDHDRWDSLPEWARRTLLRHAVDPRRENYSLTELEDGTTRDPLWNAAQTQLRREGRIHNYLRMLWGKKILEWSPSPPEALERMIHLNNKWALDGRDPNSYSGILWCLGRHDRPWAPERPIFGSVRYMSSAATARKMDVRGYVERYSPTPLSG